MASFMPCWKNALTKRLLPFLQQVLALALALFLGTAVHAQNAAELQQLRADRSGNDVLVSTNVVFDLPSVVEEALAKGIPLYFLVEADLLQERWYWYDRKISSAQRQLRLVYQPLSRRWRINVTSGHGSDSALGLSLNQNYDTLAEALATIKQISRWKVAELSEAEAAAKYRVELRFRLDLGQLPRPFQLGAIGQSEWDIQANGRVLLRAEVLR
ncbi:MAG: DUF4390 domain-containing protein [Rhodoferax sp.]